MSAESLDFGRFEALTFDCYGTLIDWETGILRALRGVFGERLAGAGDDALLEAFGRHEADLEAGPYLRYREVLRRTAEALASDFGAAASPDAAARFAGSVGEWPPFADSPVALAELHRRFRLGVITNCDDDLFAGSAARLGVGFDWVVTAEQVGSYKPSERNFEFAFERIGLPRERILHVAQSVYHDHVPAQRLGLASVWVNRRAGKAGGGATLPAEASPNLVVPDLATLARIALA